jgi:hypothetical protein
MLNYRKYIEEGLLSDNHQQIAEDQLRNIIGSEPFRDKITRKYLSRRLNAIDKREQPGLAKLNTLSVQEIIQIVGEYSLIENLNKITKGKGANRNARKIAMFMSVKHCKKICSISEIAYHFGIGVNGVASNTSRCKEEVIKNLSFRNQVEEVDALIRTTIKCTDTND